MQLVHIAEAFDYIPTRGADQVPFHFKQPQFCTMEKQVDGFRLCDPFFGRKLDGVDAEDGIIVSGVDKGLQFGNNPRRPGAGAFELSQELIQ